jgi:DNA-binding transcriptional regulator/RsmH inhibitor MraZ
MGLMMPSRTRPILSARIFEMILYTTLQQEMGLKSLALETWANFDTKAMIEWFICLRS